jgi:16S rRNA (cytosine967-C5)-methyltransferase
VSQTNPRALAAQALSRIVDDGVSLRVAFAAFSTKLNDARDRALLSALLHAGARWWHRFDAALEGLLEHSLHERESQVHALLLLGLVQLEILGLPEYAAVAATVEATRALGKAKFANLANAILRRWLRERDARNAALDADIATRSAHPQWLIQAITTDWPGHAEAILTANNAQAPLWLRVNGRRAACAELAARFAVEGIATETVAALPHALVLAQSLDVTRLPGYDEGWFSVQDGAAQRAAELLDARDGMRVLDACAAPGGKAAHILENADVNLLALDRDPQRLPRMQDNLARLGLRAEARVGDAGDPSSWWDGRPFQRILLDAPCSATGIIRRQPDVKLHRRATDIGALAQQQARLLDALWPMLAPGGRLVYATCSLLVAENAAAIGGFLARHAGAKVQAPAIGWHPAGAGVQNLPGEGGMDGFFYAIVDKAN